MLEQLTGVVGLEPAAGADALLEQAPCDGDGGQALGPAALGERVEEDVGSRVVGLARAADGARQRRAGDEEPQIEFAGELVEVQRGVDLGPQHGVKLLAGQGGDQRVVGDARRVDHAGHVVLDEQRGQRLAMRDVAGGHGDGRAQPGQVGRDRGGGRAGEAAPADQEEPAHAVGGDQMPREQGTQTAGAPRDQDGSRPLRIWHAGVRCRQALQPRYQRLATTQRDLRLPARDRPRHPVSGGPVDVNEREPAGVLGLAATRPHTGAAARSASASPSRTTTAPPVTMARRPSAFPVAHACTASRARSTTACTCAASSGPARVRSRTSAGAPAAAGRTSGRPGHVEERLRPRDWRWP